jgi:hypothetical protein
MSRVIEIVVYRVKEAASGEALRRSMRPVLAGMKGFLGWRTLTGVSEDVLMADIVEWRSLDDAKAAAEIVHSDPKCKAFMDATESLVTFEYFVEHS